MPLFLNTRDPDFEAGFRALLAMKREEAEDVDQAVAAIIADVRARGDAALIDLTAAVEDANGRERLAAVERTLSALETGLSELLAKNTDLTPIVEAIKKIKTSPVVNVAAPVVNVTPPDVSVTAAPVTVEPAQTKGSKWEIRIPSPYNGPDRVMTIERIN